ncbi:hypothetical protein [Lysobacter niastensis]|uniref:Secreted protein n=1 Tax=Lysobacter niastensis TaxID=380629 RepID=A0ABS0B559_9GAMM|nr:hypothetical protein [Lysobacter niastensis]MBF6023919.1 hypothetical protein [Lysobacter niastensis]
MLRIGRAAQQASAAASLRCCCRGHGDAVTGITGSAFCSSKTPTNGKQRDVTGATEVRRRCHDCSVMRA